MKRVLVFLTAASAWAALDPADSQQPRDTQPGTDRPPTPAEAVAALKLPEGFRATLFAGEPDVRQPIDVKFDDRGRVWVCEAYSYKEWQKKGDDRIVVFTDHDGDGTPDERRVFRTGFNHLSSVEIGFGGVWVLDVPNLLFIPDADGDAVPDGEPKVLLDGWTPDGGHNLVNGLVWGPDGWLYGRHGITQPSLVGPPGTPEEARTFIEPGVWRLHPVTHEFEVVFKGMTNPWGLDWDDEGEMFLSGNVNGHLWHGIPGALYERMFGAGSEPYDFERLKMIGERPHYPSSGDWKKDWLQAEKGRDASNDLGGGHSHCGLLIYQGENWPERYRGHFFMSNIHGRRLNDEVTVPRGASYVGKHTGDLMVSANRWFKGVSVVQAPDGTVLVSDWCDNGECHDDDGVHRSSGRIYRIAWGTPAVRPTADVSQKPDAELAEAMTSKNEWLVRHARRVLQERVVSGAELAPEALHRLHELASDPRTPVRLRALWTLHALGQLSAAERLAAAAAESPALRSWAVRLMAEADDMSAEEAAKLNDLARTETSPRVRLHLATVLDRVPPGLRWPMADALVRSAGELVDGAPDPTLQLVLWHHLQPLVASDEKKAAPLVAATVFPKLRGFVARRIAVEIEDDPDAREALGSLIQQAADGAPWAEEVMGAIRTALEGRRALPAPFGWNRAMDKFAASPSATLRACATELGLTFNDPAMLERLRARFLDAAAPADERLRAFDALRTSGVPELPALVGTAMAEPALRLAALRSLGLVEDAALAKSALALWPQLSPDERIATVDALVTRVTTARLLLEALGAKKLARTDVNTTQARQIAALGDKRLAALLAKNWGQIKTTDAAREKLVAEWKAKLSDPAAPPSDAAAGRAVFDRVCGACHTLFGRGGKLGPDLTGGGRKDLDYLLRNVIDPGAVVPRDYKMTVVTLTDGQTLSGVVPVEDEKTVTLQTVAERRVLERSRIAKLERQDYSWMPEGLLQTLPEQDVRDLVAWLRSDG